MKEDHVAFGRAEEENRTYVHLEPFQEKQSLEHRTWRWTF
jgi:hypothetical protein